MALQMFTTFNASNVTFSDVRKNAKGGKAVYLNQAGGGKLIFQLPQLRAPFGLSEYRDEASGRVSYTLPLSLDKPEVLAQFAALDERVLTFITEHSEEILGKKMSREVIAEGMYKSPVKPSTKEGYAPILNLKVVTSLKDGSISTEAYNAQRQSVPLSDLEKGQALSAIVEINQIWRTPAGVGVSIRVHQVMFAPTNKLKPCAFLAPAEEPVSDKEEVEYETDPDAE
ncbi:hypothetical protein [Yellowstone lake phycodnavirus 3]|uniref:hypothetical protein n=1 Tax=Yellowstone lake phycodnavirus 3 TaxID=1586715 RepID=UPI0006EB4308|nr:hypothetical protein AR677_gp098 [Yellowstone lake phycodnavirus 3]BAT22597.1 hypothetical protein [Yellowstone lake phycodnavirus 3]